MTCISKTGSGALVERRTRRDGWTVEKRKEFLEELSRSGNVTASARAVGRCDSGVYQLRLRDGEFARLWDEALQIAYERLETELLARALGQSSSGDNPDAAPDSAEGAPTANGAEAARPFDPQLAMAVLKLRAGLNRGRVRRAPPSAGQAEVDAELMRRLDALAERMGNTE